MRLLRRSRHSGWLTLLAFPVSYGLYRLSVPLGLLAAALHRGVGAVSVRLEKSI